MGISKCRRFRLKVLFARRPGQNPGDDPKRWCSARWPALPPQVQWRRRQGHIPALVVAWSLACL